jgi:hypothetical protein
VTAYRPMPNDGNSTGCTGPSPSVGYDHSESSPTWYRPEGTVTNNGTEPLPPPVGMADAAGTGESFLPGEQHGPVMASVSLVDRYWMAVATRMSSSGLIRWS